MNDNNNEDFFSYVYETFGNQIFNFLICRFHDRDIAEDAFQETFMTAFKKLDILKSHPNPGGWLIKTAKNKGNYLLEKKVRASGLRLDESVIDPDWDKFSEEDWLLKLDSPIFVEDKYRPLRLKYAYGYTTHEIASLYHISMDACKMRITRAKTNARRDLEQND